MKGVVWMKKLLFVLPALVLVSVIMLGGSPLLSHAGATTTTISVLASDEPCGCGSHGGTFEALYDNRKISIDFSYNPTLANPVKHPIIVLKNNESVKDWSSLICSFSDNKCPIAGSKVIVFGRWENKKSFEAYKIWIK
jgi:hypothetical protein